MKGRFWGLSEILEYFSLVCSALETFSEAMGCLQLISSHLIWGYASLKALSVFIISYDLFALDFGFSVSVSNRLPWCNVQFRPFVIFKDATNHWSSGHKHPTDQYPKRIQLRNDSRSCLGMSVSTRPMHAKFTCICLIKCLFAEKSMQFE